MLDAVTTLALLAAASWYGRGLVRGRGAVRVGQAAAWFGGLAVWAVALLGPIDRAAVGSFAVHMVQHLLLTLVGAPLLVLGGPLVVLARAGGARTRRTLSRLARSRGLGALVHPLVATAAFTVVPWAIHLTPVFDRALGSELWHALEHAAWIGSALLFWWPVLGTDPVPRPWSHPARLLALFLAMPAMSFLALAIHAAEAPLYPTAVRLEGAEAALASQRAGAVVMWIGGNLLLVGWMLVVAARWRTEEERRQRRLEAREDRARERLEPAG
ncbi:MAG: hypothetical protein KatS3mg013_0063 [Actinomycetota bacterium]|nr:MAG: hypothetical protein KatS3mg013_0063 [Actinomycetota bacterium]